MNAFPNPHLTDQTGMTLRDYFAAKAMHAFIASGDLPKAVRDEELAQSAYILADAMMEARNVAQ